MQTQFEIQEDLTINKVDKNHRFYAYYSIQLNISMSRITLKVLSFIQDVENLSNVIVGKEI